MTSSTARPHVNKTIITTILSSVTVKKWLVV